MTSSIVGVVAVLVGYSIGSLSAMWWRDRSITAARKRPLNPREYGSIPPGGQP